jgi:inner membrane protein
MKKSPSERLVMMGVVFIILMVPLTMMYPVVQERTHRRDEVVTEISNLTGGAQTLGGPVLVIPYRHSWTDSAGRLQRGAAQAHFLPESLDISGQLETETRDRSLFPVVIYRAHLKVQGQFARPDLTRVRPAPEEILWDDATVSLGVSDPKGISRRLELTLNGQRSPFVPGTGDVGIFATGVHAAAAGLSATNADRLPFELQIDLTGTRELRFLPAGNETTVHLTSTWPHPSLVGSPLADQRRVDASGFDVTWHVPYFGRGFAPQWTSYGQNTDQLKAHAATSAFGVVLMQPVDIYVQTERAVKYAALIIVMTMAIAFIWEILAAILVHPVQYLFVGFTMCLFFLLLLSLAEHTGFDAAYLIATIATVSLLSYYWSAILRGARHRWLMGAALSVLYGYLYLLLRLEDYALLAGSVGLFAMLALVMFLTRAVNWYDLRLGPERAE